MDPAFLEAYIAGTVDPVDPSDDPSESGFFHILEQGDADAQFSLGLMYRKGQGVPQDYTVALKWAHMWFNLAAAQGHEQARENRDIISDGMTPAQIAEAQRLAREWKPTKQ